MRQVEAVVAVVRQVGACQAVDFGRRVAPAPLRSRASLRPAGRLSSHVPQCLSGGTDQRKGRTRRRHSSTVGGAFSGRTVTDIR